MNYTTAKVVADTVNPNELSARITTFEVYAPRYLLAEINTHGVLAKSAASSRAIPVERRITMVLSEPWVPDVFEKNCKGMQSKEALGDADQEKAQQIWRESITDAAWHAKRLSHLGTHKQFANRVLEPYVYYHGVITGTEWDNFWALRSPGTDADPGFQVLAQKMREAYNASTPVASPYHLPYVRPEDASTTGNEEHMLRISAARCARVSYLSLETGKPSTLAEDEELIKKLTKPTGAHLSPFDHPAIADGVHAERQDNIRRWNSPVEHRRFWGWIPYRVELEEELGIKCRRDSFAPLQG